MSSPCHFCPRGQRHCIAAGHPIIDEVERHDDVALKLAGYVPIMLNGCPIGEIGCLAAIAGAMEVPTVFLSGDDKACAKAAALNPQMVTVATK
jgi:hypothetical protein